MLNLTFSLSTNEVPVAQSALSVIVASDAQLKALIAALLICAVHAPAVVTSVVTVAEVTVIGAPTLFSSLIASVLSFTLFTTIVSLLHPTSAPKLHLSGSNFEGLKTPKYANAPIIIIITRKAHAYVVRDSNAACDFLCICNPLFNCFYLI